MRQEEEVLATYGILMQSYEDADLPFAVHLLFEALLLTVSVFFPSKVPALMLTRKMRCICGTQSKTTTIINMMSPANESRAPTT